MRPALRRRARLPIHYDQRRVARAGRPVELMATECELLRVLSVNAGRVLTYDAVLDRAAGDRTKLVRAVVKRHRRKLGDDAAIRSSTYE